MGITQTHPTINLQAIDELKTALPGKVILPQDPEYAGLSQPFNLSVKQSPALIVAVHSADDIVSAVLLRAKRDWAWRCKAARTAMSSLPTGHC
jgi:hypothetical protein